MKAVDCTLYNHFLFVEVAVKTLAIGGFKGMYFLFTERFWTKTLRLLSSHGAAAVVVPLLYLMCLGAALEGVNQTVDIAGLIVALGSFLWAQMSRARHMERMAAISVDRTVGKRGKKTVDASAPKKAIAQQQNELPERT